MFVPSSLTPTRRAVMAVAYIVIGLIGGIVASIGIPAWCIWNAYQLAVNNKIYVRPAKPAPAASPNIRTITRAAANVRPN